MPVMITEAEEITFHAVRNATLQRDHASRLVDMKIERMAYTLTEHHCLKEPLRTMMFEHIDGVTVQATHAQYMTKPVQACPALIIVGLDRSTVIKVLGPPVMVRVAGTRTMAPQERWIDYGNFGLIPDDYPERRARNLLFQRGWPGRSVASGGSVTGDVVEWRWLCQELLSDDPSPGTAELFNDIVTRPGFEEFARKHDELDDALIARAAELVAAQAPVPASKMPKAPKAAKEGRA